MIMGNPSAYHTTSEAFAQPIALGHTRFHLKPKKQWKICPNMQSSSKSKERGKERTMSSGFWGGGRKELVKNHMTNLTSSNSSFLPLQMNLLLSNPNSIVPQQNNNH